MNKETLRNVRRENLKSLIDDRFSGRQADFALAVKKNPTQINHWVSGHRNPNGDTCREVEKELGLPENWLDQDTHATANITLPGFSVAATASNQAPALMSGARAYTGGDSSNIELLRRLESASDETKKLVELALLPDSDLRQIPLSPSLKGLIGYLKNQIKEETSGNTATKQPE